MKRKRKLKRVLPDQVRSCDRNDPLVMKVIDCFENKKSAKQIVNELSVDLGFVYGIKNKFCKTINNIPEQEPDEITEIKEEKKPIENTKPVRRKKRLTADEIETFAVLYLEGNKVKDIARITNRSISSVHRGLIRYQSIDPTFKLRNESDITDMESDTYDTNKNQFKKEEKHIERKKEFKVTTLSGTKVKTVGLIYGRHEEIPATEFIFQEVSSNLMFDYDKQEKLCREYINDLVENGYTSLDVYVTGLSCITASLSKVAIEEGFGLTLKHYDKKTETYKDQIIVPVNISSGSPEYSELLSIYNNLNLVDDIDKNSSKKYKYIITVGEYTNKEYADISYVCYTSEVLKTLISSMIDRVIKFDATSGEVSIYRLDYIDGMYKVGMKVM